MANIVLKNTKNQPSVANGSYRFDGVPMETMKLPLPTGNPKLNASQLQTPLKLS
jgi:hypothetical protein